MRLTIGSNVRAGGDLLLMAASGLIGCAGALAFVPLLIFVLIAVMAVSASLVPLLWVAIALFVAVYDVVLAAEQLASPRLRPLLVQSGLTIMASSSFPLASRALAAW